MAVYMQIFREQLEEEEHPAERGRLRRPRVFRDRTYPLDAYDDLEIIKRYRLSRECIVELHNILQDELEPRK